MECRRFTVVASSALLALLASPSLARALPGELLPIGVGTQGNNYGYWEYLPTAYDGVEPFPALVFLSGIGEVGNGTHDGVPCPFPAGSPDFDGDANLCNNLRHGPQFLIQEQVLFGGDAWLDDERPFVVVAPQNPIPYDAYDRLELDIFFEYLLDTYAIDPRRMYLMGMSQGGRSSFLYTHQYPDRFAAVSTMPGIAFEIAPDECLLTPQNYWAFHGENDTDSFMVGQIIAFYERFLDCPAPRPTPRLTVYLGAGHNVWTRTVDPPVGMDDPVDPAYDPYDIDVYSWLLLHDKPVVDAGPDQAVPFAPTLELIATVTDDDPVTFTWTQTAGAALVLVDDDTATPTAMGVMPGDYEFEVLAVDADGQWDRDQVAISVDEPIPGGSSSGDASTGGAASSSGGTSSSGAAETGPGDDTTGLGVDGTATGGTSGGGTSGGGMVDGSSGPGGTDPSGGSAPGETTVPDPSGPSGGAGSGHGGSASTGGEQTAGQDGGGAGSGGCRVAPAGSPLGAGLLGLLVLGALRRRND